MHPVSQWTLEYSHQYEKVVCYIVCKVLVSLDYFLGIRKCVLVPVIQIQYLGMLVDSVAQAFRIPKDVRTKFAQLLTRTNTSP